MSAAFPVVKTNTNTETSSVPCLFSTTAAASLSGVFALTLGPHLASTSRAFLGLLGAPSVSDYILDHVGTPILVVHATGLQTPQKVFGAGSLGHTVCAAGRVRIFLA